MSEDMEAIEGGQRKMSPADRTGSRTRIISERLGSTACGHIPRQSLAARDSETIKSSRNKSKSSLTIAKLSAFDEGGFFFDGHTVAFLKIRVQQPPPS